MLIDGSLQFGDLRALLKVPTDAPSILDLPTDRIAESDLGDVLWRDPSGIDILLAPPRDRDGRDDHRRATSTRSCRCCAASTASIVIDMSSVLNDINLAFLDASDTIVEIVTYDSTTIHNTVAMADTFRSIGYPASKVRYLVNRADSPGGIDPATSSGRSAACPSTASSPTGASSSSPTTRACRSSWPTRRPRSARTSRASRREILGSVRPAAVAARG